MRRVNILAICAVLAACQTTSGQLGNSETICETISPFTSRVTWEVFGDAKQIETCNSEGVWEKYRLKNARISYQEAAYGKYYPSLEERVFREALARNQYFKSSYKAAAAHDPKINNGDALYSLYEGRSIYESRDRVWCAYFRMRFGTPELRGNLWGRTESLYGAVCGNPGMSKSNFQQDFEKRIRAITSRSSQGQKQTFGFKPYGPKEIVGKQKDSTVDKTSKGVATLSAKKLCKQALGFKADTQGWNYSYNDFINEAHRRGFSISDCRKHAGYVSTPTASKSTSASKSIEERLQKLKQLIDRGLITKDEAKAKRKEILGGL